MACVLLKRGSGEKKVHWKPERRKKELNEIQKEMKNTKWNSETQNEIQERTEWNSERLRKWKENNFSGEKKKKYSGYSPKPWDFAIWFQEAVISCITQMPPLKQRQKKAKK